MRRAGLLLLLASPLWAEPPVRPPEELLQRGVDLYRQGRLLESMDLMTEVLNVDPENATAQNYLWTAAKKVGEEEKGLQMSSTEEKQAVDLALRHLAERRRQVNGALKQLEATYDRTRDVRSPQDMLSSLEGMDESLGADFEGERVGEQAEAYHRKILENLGSALQKNVFIAQKDALAARAYLAYYQSDWAGALKLWDEAVKAAPDDEGVRKQRDHLQALLSNREKQEKILEASRQAETLQKTGYFQEAAEAWKDVVALDPRNAEAKRNMLACQNLDGEIKKEERLRNRTNEAIRLYRAGNAFDAMQVLLEVLQADPAYKQARVWLGEVGKKLRVAPAEPVAASPSAGAARPVTHAAQALEQYKKGILLYSDDRIPEAVQAWKLALTLDPDLQRARQALEQAQSEIGFQKP